MYIIFTLLTFMFSFTQAQTTDYCDFYLPLLPQYGQEVWSLNCEDWRDYGANDNDLGVIFAVLYDVAYDSEFDDILFIFNPDGSYIAGYGEREEITYSDCIVLHLGCDVPATLLRCYDLDDDYMDYIPRHLHYHNLAYATFLDLCHNGRLGISEAAKIANIVGFMLEDTRPYNIVTPNVTLYEDGGLDVVYYGEVVYSSSCYISSWGCGTADYVGGWYQITQSCQIELTWLERDECYQMIQKALNAFEFFLSPADVAKIDNVLYQNEATSWTLYEDGGMTINGHSGGCIIPAMGCSIPHTTVYLPIVAKR